ncbi:hypothetical protein [Nocardia sp. NPDC004722]
MGLNYTFELYMNQDIAESVLLCVAKDAGPSGETSLIFPDGHEVIVPLKSKQWYPSQTVENQIHVTGEDEGWDFTISLLFDEDEHLQAYDPRNDSLVVNADGRRQHRIGDIWFSIATADRVRPGQLAFRFVAVTSRMSRLFLASLSIRDYFAGLAIAHGGLLCMLDVEQDSSIAISAGTHRLFDRVPGQRWASVESLMAEFDC